MLIVSQYFWPESFRINDISRALVERGADVEVLTGKPNYPEGTLHDGYRFLGCTEEPYHGAKVVRVPLLPRGKGSKVRLALNYLSFIFFGSVSGAWVLRGRAFDSILVYGMSPILQALPAIFIGWLKGAPVVVFVQDLWPDSIPASGYLKNKWVVKLVELVVRFIYGCADLLLVQSEAFLEPIEALAGATPVEYYPNSVDPSFALPPTEPVQDVPHLDRGFSVVFGGNLGTAQGVEVIVEAATLLKEHTDIDLVVVGDGSRREWMLEEARRRDLANFHLPGRRPVEMMPDLFQKASALLVTLADEPIFAVTVPNKVQAYMAAGRPILACVRGEGARLVTAAGAGLAVPVGDGEALAEAVLQLHAMSVEEREEMGRNGRSYFLEHFDHDRLMDRLHTRLDALSETPGGVR